MKVKLFVARKIHYFELGVFSFYSYVYYLTRGFIASTRPFNLLTRAFHPPTRAFGLPTPAFNLAIRVFSLLTRGSEFVTCGLELVTRRFEFVTRNSCFTSPRLFGRLFSRNAKKTSARPKYTPNFCNVPQNKGGSGSRAAATSKMECFVIIVYYYHKALHLGCYSSPRSASERAHNPSKVAAVKNFFLQCVCYRYNLVRLMFFIPYNH